MRQALILLFLIITGTGLFMMSKREPVQSIEKSTAHKEKFRKRHHLPLEDSVQSKAAAAREVSKPK